MIKIMTWNLKDYGAGPTREAQRYNLIHQVITDARPTSCWSRS